MKKANLLILLWTMISSVGNSNAQEIVVDSTTTQPMTYRYEFENLPISEEGAFYSHLWWFGDNQFSFEEIPTTTFPRSGMYTVFAAPTENYGTGGPPPKTVVSNPNSGAPINGRVLPQGSSIHVQHYRNAVPDDTMYLIVTYAVPSILDPNKAYSGSLVLDTDPATGVLAGYVNAHPEFRPNGENFNQSKIWSFSNLKGAEERSILVPLIVLSPNQEEVSFRVTLNIDNYELPPNQGVSEFILSVPVAESHDPNFMLEQSLAMSNCDFGGEPIDYDIHFQNVGDTTTYFVSVTCHLDPKLNLSSIGEIVLPKEYGNATISAGNGIQGYQPNTGAFYFVNEDNRTITFEFNDLVLRSTQDPTCKDLDLTRSSVSFQIRVLPNYKFGPSVISHSTIVFDNNDPIETNAVETTCQDPFSPGGFYRVDPTIHSITPTVPEKTQLKRP